MKKIILLTILFFSIYLLNAQITWMGNEYTTIGGTQYLGDDILFEIQSTPINSNQGAQVYIDWNNDGYGGVLDVDYFTLNYIENIGNNTKWNKYVRMQKTGTHNRKYLGWETGQTDYSTANMGTFTITALTDPASNTASTINSTQIDLGWTQWSSKNVMIVRKLSTDSWTEPTQGTAYIAGNSIGNGIVVYNGASTNYSNTSLSPSTSYDFKFYSVNNDYYSSGTVVSTTTGKAISSSSSTDWNITSTWNSGTIPTSIDDVTILNDVVISNTVNDIDAECYNLTVESGSSYTSADGANHTIHGSLWVIGTLNIAPNSSFTITRNLWVTIVGQINFLPKSNLIVNGTTENNNNNGINLNSDATGTASFKPIGAYSGAGTLNVQRYISQDVWHYISAPVADTRIFNVSGFLDLTAGGSNDQLYYWNESATISGIGTGIWYDILNGPTYSTGSFNTSQGYAITKKGANKTITFTGAPFTSNQSIPITYTAGSSNPGANMVGNPFTSSIAVNSNAQLTNNIIDINASILNSSALAIYLWDENISDYTIVSNAIGATYIEPGQGFMVVANTVGGTFNFNTNMRKHGAASFYKSENSNRLGVDLHVVDSEARTNSTQIAFMENMTFGLDPSYDGMKLKGNPNIALYTRLVEDNGVDFAIQALPDNEIESISIPVGIDVIESTMITFSITSENMEAYPIYLEDTQEHTITNLKEQTYKTLVAESGTGRFFLHFRDISGINDIQPTEHVNIFSANDNIEIRSNSPIDASVNIYSIAGQLITSTTLNNQSSASVNIPNFKGIAIVSIVTKGHTLTKKVIMW